MKMKNRIKRLERRREGFKNLKQPKENAFHRPGSLKK